VSHNAQRQADPIEAGKMMDAKTDILRYRPEEEAKRIKGFYLIGQHNIFYQLILLVAFTVVASNYTIVRVKTIRLALFNIIKREIEWGAVTKYLGHYFDIFASAPCNHTD
jgi:hypothetical protein